MTVANQTLRELQSVLLGPCAPRSTPAALAVVGMEGARAGTYLRDGRSRCGDISFELCGAGFGQAAQLYVLVAGGQIRKINMESTPERVTATSV